mmetsp:Transcript_36869/g.79434  ORF Transcript_36869/g.79434 Transcript_36869/m.79434 type:complete len:81 (+) Transcript_36869:911-1153(+)
MLHSGSLMSTNLRLHSVRHTTVLLRCETRIVSAKGFSEHSELSLETSDFGHFVSFCHILLTYLTYFVLSYFVMPNPVPGA